MGNSQGKPVIFTDEGMFNESLFDRSSVLVLPPHLRALDRLSLRIGKNSSFCHMEVNSSHVSGNHHNSTRIPADHFSTHTVNLNHFRLLRVVGKGAFGKVRIVERKDTGLTFALKYIRKDEGKTDREQCSISTIVLTLSQSSGRRAFVISSEKDGCWNI